MGVRAIKIAGVVLVLVFISNAVLASTARYNLRSLSKISHTNRKRGTSKRLIPDDPTPNDDYSVAFHSAKRRIRNLLNPSMAIATAFLTSVTFGSVSIVPIKTSQPFSDNITDIFIPPRIAL